MNSRDRDETIEDAAANWDARLRGSACSADDRLAFTDWLEQSAEHRAAYDQLQAAFDLLGDHVAHPRLRAMRDAGRLAVRQSARRRWERGAGVAAALALAIGAGLWGYGRTDEGMIRIAEAGAMMQNGQLYHAALAERSQVRLADGTEVMLDSESRMIVRLSEGRRDITLLAGQARFSVAKDPDRPFVVRAGDRTVTALGTEFDVSLRRGRATVTLIEGRVEVAQDRATTIVFLSPNQQLAAGSTAEPRAVDVERALGWTEGRLYFDDEPLSSAIETMNRYSEAKIVLANPDLGDLRISGMFRTGNQTGFVGALQVTLPVEAHQDDRNRIIVSSVRH